MKKKSKKKKVEKESSRHWHKMLDQHHIIGFWVGGPFWVIVGIIIGLMLK